MAVRVFLLGILLLSTTDWRLSGGWALPSIGPDGPAGSAPSHRPCGSLSFYPQSQCCCRSDSLTTAVTAGIPQKECQCCGETAYRFGDTSSMPSGCTKPCGDKVFHEDTQRCCAKTVINVTWPQDPTRGFYCCGNQVIDYSTHRCCGLEPASEFPIERGLYGCCGNTIPFHKPTMRCKSRKAHLKSKQKFSPQQLCDMTLPIVPANVSLPVRPESHKHTRGLPLVCQITTDGEYVVVALSPFVIRGQTLPLDCDKSDTLYLIIKRQGDGHCASLDALQTYFHGNVVDVYSKKNVVCSKGRPTLRLRTGNNAVVYLSSHSQSILENSLN